ncbi:hypothetical protein ABZ930_12825 [Streptomyces sp. NPDC046716]|uniref:hypothetical protein n=1 Tax=Streptomyces sp. NPDC046716 TaxID=3157093 RepID=UPI0033D4C136
MTSMRGVRATGAALLTAALAVGAAGCSDSDNNSPSSSASKAASAVSSAASRAGDAVASATAEAGKKFDEFKNGVNAKDDVTLGSVETKDGYAAVPVNVTNKASSTKSFLVQVDFKDSSGNRLDTVAVTVSDVAAGKSEKATAQSNRSLGGDVRADVARALQH